MADAYYNEFDPNAAAWLRNLGAAGLIPGGTVDERSIRDVEAADLPVHQDCHFFAGIGGWPLALQIAGWPEGLRVWTGSCPCQPYSSAGRGEGDDDPRNLWPAFFGLIRECRPDFVFGEQVANAIGHGWLDGISADLEREGYACGAAVLGAHSVGAPHIRHRLYWVAYAGEQRLDGREGIGRGGRHQAVGCEAGDHAGADRITGGAALAASLGCRSGLRGEPRHGPGGESTSPASDARHWEDFDLVPCRDGKSRRVEPGTFPLATGIPDRVVKLRGYGNAIVPQVGAEFVTAFMDTVGIRRRGAN